MSEKTKGDRTWDKARSQIMMSHPFYAYPMSQLQWKRAGDPGCPPLSDIPTAATDGRFVVYNPEFIEKIGARKAMFVIAHEVMHVMLKHPLRRKPHHDPFISNIAMDICINYLLKKDGFELVEQCAYDEDLYTRGQGIWENIYDLLMQQVKQRGKGGGRGQKGPGDFKEFDQVNGGPKDEAEKAQLEQEIDDMVGSAVAVARQAGKGSAGMERLAQDIGRPKIDYAKILRQFFTSPAKVEHSFQRPSRRSIARDAGYYLPSMSGTRLGACAILVDVSGSITNEMVAEFGSHVKAICEDTMPEKMHVAYFDSQVCHADVFERGEEVILKPHGGGGTDFVAAFEWVNEYVPDCQVCVMLTDNYPNNGHGPAPSYPVLFVIKEGCPLAVPFGSSVEMQR